VARAIAFIPGLENPQTVAYAVDQVGDDMLALAKGILQFVSWIKRRI
jgi:hypothetical protein